ncbi:MAG: chemotaxis response regulator CheY [Deltaproteobacteria bacterium]|nr:chemotaxis response regulator CheY [Deltaproteobacteria bacterium]
MVDADKRFLVVDDFATMRKIVRNLLRQLGYQHIDEAEDGVVALRKLKSTKYDMIICDWNMPNMTGIELLREVRSDESLKVIPFLMVTAEANKENVIEAVKAGVSNYIVKPFTADTLSGKIDAVLKK